MPDKPEIKLLWPAKGLVRNLAYRFQDPTSTPDALNVRTTDIYEERFRGGSRPGMTRAFPNVIGGGQPVNMLNSVRGSLSQSSEIINIESAEINFFDHFDSAPLSTAWSANPGVPLVEVYNPPSAFSGFANNTKAAGDTGVLKAAIRGVPEGFDSSKPYAVTLKVWPWMGEHFSSWWIAMLMNNTTPNIQQDSVYAAFGLTMDGPTAKLQFQFVKYIAGTPTAIGTVFEIAGINPFVSNNLRLLHNNPQSIGLDNELVASFNGTDIGTFSVNDELPGIVGLRMGFAMLNQAPTDQLFVQRTDWFSLVYNKFISEDFPGEIGNTANYLVAASNKQLYIAGPENPTELVPTNHDEPMDTNVNDGRHLMAAERGGRLYIADHGPPKWESSTGTLDASGLVLTDANAAFLTLDPEIDIENDCLFIYSAPPQQVAIGSVQGSAYPGGVYVILGHYRITGFTATTLTITKYTGFGVTNWDSPCTSNCGAGVSATSLFYRIERAPKVYDPINNKLNVWWQAQPGFRNNSAPASVFSAEDIAFHGLDTTVAVGDFKGFVPIGSPIIARWRDRIITVGPEPHVWRMSRVGDPYDWFLGYAADDVGRPMFDQNTLGGVIGQPITAIIPHSDDYCVFASLGQLWVLRGDPALGGNMDNLSDVIGIVDRRSWCRGPLGETYFLARDGMYRLAPGAANFPEQLSPDIIPQELRKIDSNFVMAFMGYDLNSRGADIYLTPKGDNTTRHYWWDYRFKAFWPQTIPATHDPWSMLSFESDNEEQRALLLGCRDGTVRKFVRTATTDDGTPFNSHVLFGPYVMGANQSDYFEGILNEFIAVLADQSEDITFTLYVADTAEGAFRKFQMDEGHASATLSAGRNPTHRPRGRGFAFILKLSSP